MPKGGLSDAFAQQGSGGGGGDDDITYFKLKDGESYVVRFLESGDDIAWCYTHPGKTPEGWKYPLDVICLDQTGMQPEKCPGCQMRDPEDPSRSLRRAFSGFINVLVENGPIYGKKESGYTDFSKVVGHGDVVMTWNAGRRIFDEIAGKDAQYKDIRRFRFVVKRTGSGFNDTRYAIDPALAEDSTFGPSEPTEEQQKLIDAKPNLDPYVTPLGLDGFKKEMGLIVDTEETVAQAVAAGSEANPFETTAGDMSAFAVPKS